MPANNKKNNAAFADERGVALLTVMIFALVVGIAGLAFYALASYENKGARDRQHSLEAFYLADGAIEQARGEFLARDLSWRGPIATTALGSGSYDLAMRDTTWNGQAAVLLHAEGYVDDTKRGVEAFASLVPTAQVLALLVNGNIDAKGNLSIFGAAHANGIADFGNNDSHLADGVYDDGYVIKPPAITTDPDFYDDATYYRVTGSTNPVVHGIIERWNRGTQTWDLWDDTTLDNRIVSWKGQDNAYEFKFDVNNFASNKSAIEYFFESNNGVFKINHPAGDDHVMVDFSQVANAPDIVADVVLSSDGYQLEATIINTRFEGIDDEERIWPPCNGKWVGGFLSLRGTVEMVPRGCISIIAHEIGPRKGGGDPNAQTSFGMEGQPALTYVTGSVNGLKGTVDVHGALITLCDFQSTGGPDIHFDPSFYDCLPDNLRDLWDNGSGIMNVLEWREVGL